MNLAGASSAEARLLDEIHDGHVTLAVTRKLQLVEGRNLRTSGRFELHEEQGRFSRVACADFPACLLAIERIEANRRCRLKRAILVEGPYLQGRPLERLAVGVEHLPTDALPVAAVVIGEVGCKAH